MSYIINCISLILISISAHRFFHTVFLLQKKRLVAIGGSTIRESINRILCLLTTPRTLALFNWTGCGTSHKVAFRKLTALIQLITGMHLWTVIHFYSNKPSPKYHPSRGWGIAKYLLVTEIIDNRRNNAN